MINTNQDENHNDELKLSPLGTDEINSVIKSFKNSTFNQEELYKKDEKNFVKKTLFDLAKESERNSSEENQTEGINLFEKDLVEKKINESEEVVKEFDQKDDFGNTHSLSELEKNNGNNEKEFSQVDESIDKSIKSEEVSEENLNRGFEESNEEILDTKHLEPNKIEYEEKTLEALDSVREAVSKSLEENSENQNEEINNNSDEELDTVHENVSKSLEENSENQNEEINKNPNNSKIVSNNINSEINLINNLFKNIREISNDEIENIVKSKVIELAEDVIGYQIEKFPDKFLNKIKNSINDIKSINNDVRIYLNNNDLELLNKFIDKNEVEVDFKLDLDSSLGRGDFTIDMGGVIQSIKYKKVIE